MNYIMEFFNINKNHVKNDNNILSQFKLFEYPYFVLTLNIQNKKLGKFVF